MYGSRSFSVVVVYGMFRSTSPFLSNSPCGSSIFGSLCPAGSRLNELGCVMFRLLVNPGWSSVSISGTL